MMWAMRRQFCRRVVIGEAGHLLLGEHVPQPELDPQPAVGLRLHRAGDQRLAR